MKNIIKVLFFSFLVLGSFSAIETNDASAASILASPANQEKRGTPATVKYDLSWSGTSGFYVYHRRDTGASWTTILGNTNTISKSGWTHVYDLGSLGSKTWNGTFRVVDYYGSTATQAVTTKHYRYN